MMLMNVIRSILDWFIPNQTSEEVFEKSRSEAILAKIDAEGADNCGRAIMLCKEILRLWAAHSHEDETISDLINLGNSLEGIFGVPVDGDEVPEVLFRLESGKAVEEVAHWLREFGYRELAAA